MNPGDAWTVSAARHRRGASICPCGKRPGFTLIEMVIVVGIVLVIMGIALPSINTMWAHHRENAANNGISGMLMSTRAKSIQGDRGEVGMFFYLNDRGVQQIALITRDPRIEQNPPLWATECAWRDVFTVAEDGGQALLSPMRVVPRYVVDDPNSGDSTRRFSPSELGNEDFNNPAPLPIDNAQRHRNYFVVMFSLDGGLLPARDVLIRDRDIDRGGEGDGFGDITGLPVSDDVDKYFGRDGVKVAFADACNQNVRETIGEGNDKLVDFIVPPEDMGTALNFPSVDGLMVYDNSALPTDGNDEDKRQTLLEIARPYYIHRLSGAVIRGPAGDVPPKIETNP